MQLRLGYFLGLTIKCRQKKKQRVVLSCVGEEKQRQTLSLLEYEYFIKKWLHLSNLFLTARQNRFCLLIGKAVTLAYQEEDSNWDLGVDISKYFCLITDSAFLPKGSWKKFGKDHVETKLKQDNKNTNPEL